MNQKLKELRDKLTDKQAKFVELVVAGQDRGDAYKAANYKPKTLQVAQQEASRLLTQNVKVITYFEAMQCEIERKLNITRGMQLRKLNDTFKIATVQNNPSAMVSAIREQNEMLGFHREHAPNLEKEEKRREIIENEVVELKRIIRERTAELSEPVRPLLPASRELSATSKKDDELWNRPAPKGRPYQQLTPRIKRGTG